MELDRFEFSGSLPRGIVESNSDLELKSLREDSRLKVTILFPHLNDKSDVLFMCILQSICILICCIDFVCMEFFAIFIFSASSVFLYLVMWKSWSNLPWVRFPSNQNSSIVPKVFISTDWILFAS